MYTYPFVRLYITAAFSTLITFLQFATSFPRSQIIFQITKYVLLCLPVADSMKIQNKSELQINLTFIVHIEKNISSKFE